MLEPFKYEKKISVYGSRVMGVKEKYNFFFFKGKHPKQGFGPYFMNKILQVLFRILYKNNITDLLTGYKIYEKKFINLKFSRFLETEIVLVAFIFSASEIILSTSLGTFSCKSIFLILISFLYNHFLIFYYLV